MVEKERERERDKGYVISYLCVCEGTLARYYCNVISDE